LRRRRRPTVVPALSRDPYAAAVVGLHRRLRPCLNRAHNAPLVVPALSRDPYAAADVVLRRRWRPCFNREHNAVWVPASRLRSSSYGGQAAGTTRIPIQLSNSERVCARIPAAHRARVMPETLPLRERRGRRECRVHAAPAVSCAKNCAFGAHEHTGERKHSDIPCAMALRLISRSPR
jgi:hypothetical protein